MPSMRAVLQARQKAAAAQVKDLEAELDRVRAALAEAEEGHRRRVIGLEQYLEALAEENASAARPGPPAIPEPAADPALSPTRHRSGPSRTGADAPDGRPHSRTCGRDSHTQEWPDWTRPPRPRGLLLLAGLDNRELPRGLPSCPRTRQLTRSSTLFETRPTTRTDREQPVRQPLWGEPLRSWPQRRALPGRSTDCPTRRKLTGP
jgi:hypothetical protein